ncbi:hypothetical protein D3C80_1171490 [compost metagenome]
MQCIGGAKLVSDDDAEPIVGLRLQLRQDRPDFAHEPFAVILTDDFDCLGDASCLLQIDGFLGFSQLVGDGITEIRQILLVLLLVLQHFEKSGLPLRQQAQGLLIWAQILDVVGQQITPLPRFNVLHRRQDIENGSPHTAQLGCFLRVPVVHLHQPQRSGDHSGQYCNTHSEHKQASLSKRRKTNHSCKFPACTSFARKLEYAAH